MSAVTWQVDRYLDNFSNLPTHVLHGENDNICPVRQPRSTCASMKDRGFPVEYQEIAGAAHEVRVWGKLGSALKKLAKSPRQRYPKKVAKRLQTEHTPWCYWIRVDGLKRKGNGKANAPPTAWVEASIENQMVTIKSEGIKKLTVCLAPEMVDLDEKVEIRHNGKRVHQTVPERNFEQTLRVAVEKGDWLAAYSAFVEIR